MKKCFYTEKGPKAIGPYATACTAGHTVYFSGMLGVNPETGALAGDVASQARQSLDNLSAVAGEMGLSLDMTVKTTVFLTNLNDFAIVNGIYQEYFGPDYPARSCVQVAALPKGAQVEIEAILYKAE